MIMLIRSVSFEKQSLQNRGLLQILKKKQNKADFSFYLEEELTTRMSEKFIGKISKENVSIFKY